MKNNLQISENIINRIIVYSFICVLVYSLWALTRGWFQPLLDIHGFRQTQTAISALSMLEGGPLIAYETPVLGAPWSIPFEFPLYQWIVVLVSRTGMFPLDQVGRLVSVMFFYLTLYPLWILLRSFEIKPHQRLIFLTLFLCSPLYLFWSRTFMIESTALFVSVAYVASAFEYFHKRKKALLWLAAFFGILGIVKVTTFFAFFLLVGVIWIRTVVKNLKEQNKYWYLYVYEFFLLFFVQTASIVIWTIYTDEQKLLNPLAADFITSTALTTWNFGTLAQRISWHTWSEVVWERVFTDVFGNPYIALYMIVSIFAPSRFIRYTFLSIFLFLISFLTFTNIHIVHNYYQYANGIFLLFALGCSITTLLQTGDMTRYVGLALYFFVLISSCIGWKMIFYSAIFSTQGQHIRSAQFLREHTNNKDIALIYGLDWSSEIPYYSQRRAIMDREFRSLEDPKMQASFKRSFNGEARLGAVLFCNGTQNKKDKIDSRMRKLHFKSLPSYEDSYCEIHLPS